MTDYDGFDAAQPTRTSSAIAVGTTVLVVAALLLQLGRVFLPAAVGALGAVGFAASLWLLDHDRWRGLASILTGVLTLPVGASLAVGTVGAMLLLVGAFFPVDHVASIPNRVLLVISIVGVALGSILAILGAAVGVRNLLERDLLARYYWLAIRTGIVPAAVAGLLTARAFLAHRGESGGPGSFVGSILADLLSWLLRPSTDQTHLAALFLVLAVTALVLKRLLGVLPLAELLADRGAGETADARLDRANYRLGQLATVGFVLALLLFVAELALSPAALRATVGPGVADLLVAVSTAPALRYLLLGILALALPLILGIGLLQRVAQSTRQRLGRVVGPFIAGGVLLFATAATADSTVAPLFDWITTQLPPVYAAEFTKLSGNVLDIYGALAVGTLLVSLLIGLLVGLTLSLRFVLYMRYVSPETPGYSLASGGLFVAVALGGTLAIPSWLIVAGLVGAFLVRDTGEFATTLGQEIGRVAPTRDAELVHAGGTLLVGLAGAAVAMGLNSVVTGIDLSGTAGSTVALAFVFAAIIFLVAALR